MPMPAVNHPLAEDSSAAMLPERDSRSRMSLTFTHT